MPIAGVFLLLPDDDGGRAIPFRRPLFVTVHKRLISSHSIIKATTRPFDFAIACMLPATEHSVLARQETMAVRSHHAAITFIAPST